jgi:hypothetical protein
MCFGDATHLPSIKFQTHKEPSKETAKSRRKNNNNNPSKKEIINPFQKEKKKNCSEELNYDKVPVQTVRVKSNTHSVIVTTVDSSPLKTAYGSISTRSFSSFFFFVWVDLSSYSLFPSLDVPQNAQATKVSSHQFFK